MRLSKVLVGILFITLAAFTLGCGGNKADAPSGEPTVPSSGTPTIGDIASAVGGQLSGSVQAQGNTGLTLNDVIVTQAVDGEPLILNKDTVVRAVVSTTGNSPVNVQATVQFDGKSFTQSESVQGKQQIIDVPVGAPQNFQTQNIKVRVDTANSTSDADSPTNYKTVGVPMVKPGEKLVAFFIPVDWTPDQQQRYNYPQAIPQFVKDNETYLRGAYPLGNDQIVVYSTLTPHMLAVDEKQLADNQGDEDYATEHLLYASISIAGRRIHPDATMVVGVLPPGWFAAHGDTQALGISLRDVKGTVTALYAFTNPIVTAHELAHLFWLYEDYDYATDPPRPFTFLDRSGYFVQEKLPEDISPSKKIPTFLSSYSPDNPAWVDTRAYEYLMAKLTIGNGGQATEPMIVNATIARQVEPDGKNYPSDYSGDYQRFEPKNTVYVSVGAIGMGGGETLEARWYQGSKQIFSKQQQLNPGDGWYAFQLSNRNGMPQSTYHVDILLNGTVVKTAKFEVKSSQ